MTSLDLFRRLCLLFGLAWASVCAAEVAAVTPADAAKLVATGTAVLVDVREPAEWTETGVAAPAVLLAKSTFDAEQAGDWKPFLEKFRDKQIILYCRTGRRSGAVAAVLASQGYKVANAGGFKDWQAAGLPVRPVAAPAPGK
jgi:rhodanese-related sulfurtransferase